MIKALLFDFDGLILETEMPAFQAWQEIYREYGCELPLAEWVACVGGTVKDFDPCQYLEALTGRSIERVVVETKRRQRQLELVARQKALPGVENYLAEARRLGLKVGLASNSSRAWVTGHLRRLGLFAQFDCLKCGDEVSHPKPDPELYFAALEALNTPADQAIAFEDSPNGVRAARAAGIFCVAVPNVITQQLSLDHADLRLPSLSSRPLTELISDAECQLKKRNSLMDTTQ
jgi:HAD superfamily hydrolase (TIGR01509 family)